jgi:hypothetical protein
MARRMDTTRAAEHFAVSEDLMNFRYHMSGAAQIQRRAAARAT